MSSDTFLKAALEYHRQPVPGKLKVVATKPLGTQKDLALAYSPGVAAACEAIAKDPLEAASLTTRSNLVAVVTNGTAVLGLGAIGPLAAKPVMEGKAVLFKKFAGLDVFDLEIQENNPEKLVDIIASLEPTFGGINLEDIKAPECFYVEEKLRERMKIPVFHDDQHGTAIIVAAAVLNGLRLVGKDISQAKCVVSGAGAAALSCLDLMVAFGLKRENIYVADQAGILYEGRAEKMDAYKNRYAQRTDARKLADAMPGADIFLGLSAAGVVTQDMVKAMAPSPLILALANPVPEILPEKVREVRDDAIIATGRSDYPNQVNNVLCFPYIFRGALDVGATQINEAMKMACVQALADLALAEPSDVVTSAYGGEEQHFGREYLIPKPFDPRLITQLAPAVAKAAMETGVATRPIDDFEAYHQSLSEFVFRSGMIMKPVLASAKRDPKRVVYAEGEDERILRAVQTVVDDGIAYPILIGRREVVSMRLKKLGLRLNLDKDFELVDPENDSRYGDYWRAYHQLMERKGITQDHAKTILRTNTTVIAALMTQKGDADAALCGPVGRYEQHLVHLKDILGLTPNNRVAAALSGMVLEKGFFFFSDGYVNHTPNADEIVEITMMAAQHLRNFGLVPKIALLSHSNFGSSSSESSGMMRKALETLTLLMPDVELEGEMHADAALNPEIRQRIFPNSRLKGVPNLLIFPQLESANIALNIAKVLGDGQPLGPILLGLQKPAHILTPSVTSRGIANMTGIAVVDAQKHKNEQTFYFSQEDMQLEQGG
ncbi:MAG: NADP-dependent malic enzyme [Alphaproteobacteria bacterium]